MGSNLPIEVDYYEETLAMARVSQVGEQIQYAG